MAKASPKTKAAAKVPVSEEKVIAPPPAPTKPAPRDLMTDHGFGKAHPLLEPELMNLRDRETALSNEIERLKKMDAGHIASRGHDLDDVIKKTEDSLVSVRKQIEDIKGAQ